MTTKMRIAASTVLAACFAVSGPSFADDHKTVGSGPNPYSDCGIGAAIFPQTHWAAATSNVIWDLGTTAITSATASPQTCSGKRLAAALFINDTYEQLAEQTAAGEGEHLAALLDIMECASERQPAAIHAVRGAMGRAVAAPGYAGQSHLEKAAELYGIVESAVQGRCSV